MNTKAFFFNSQKTSFWLPHKLRSLTFCDVIELLKRLAIKDSAIDLDPLG